MRSFLCLAVIIGSLPNQIANGQLADAVPLMADLNFIVNQVNANAAPLANTALLNAANSFTQAQSGIAASSPANFPIASQVQNWSFNTLSSALGTNTVTARISSLTLSQYASGQIFAYFPPQQNTGPATINVDNVGSINVLNAGSTLTGGELRTIVPALIAYDVSANAFDLLNGPQQVQGPNIPSAATLNLDAQQGDYHQIDNTANITAMTLSRGRQKWLEFTSSPLLSHSASLILGSNVTPFPGDVMAFRGEASGVVRLIDRFNVNRTTKNMTRTVKTSGSGLYVPPVGCTHYNARLWGGGGGGGASDTNNGSTGSDTTFGPFGIGGLSMTAGGGGGGGFGGGGGTNSPGNTSSNGDININGETGKLTNGAGTGSPPNSGGGGGGGNGGNGGGAGGRGGYSEKIVSPAVPKLFSVGGGGNGGAAGTAAGANGASGLIIIDEYY